MSELIDDNKITVRFDLPEKIRHAAAALLELNALFKLIENDTDIQNARSKTYVSASAYPKDLEYNLRMLKDLRIKTQVCKDEVYELMLKLSSL